jgi:ABC-type branched-subunit amino acid transport system permease subunit
VLAAAVAGVAVGVPSLRLRGDYLAIVTLGFGEIIRITIESTDRLGGSQGYPIGAGSIPAYAGLAWVWGAAVLATVLVWNLTYSSYGRALAAIREDEIAAEAAGIPTTRYKVLAFSVSAAVAGLAGEPEGAPRQAGAGVRARAPCCVGLRAGGKGRFEGLPLAAAGSRQSFEISAPLPKR